MSYPSPDDRPRCVCPHPHGPSSSCPLLVIQPPEKRSRTPSTVHTCTPSRVAFVDLVDEHSPSDPARGQVKASVMVSQSHRRTSTREPHGAQVTTSWPRPVFGLAVLCLLLLGEQSECASESVSPSPPHNQSGELAPTPPLQLASPHHHHHLHLTKLLFHPPLASSSFTSKPSFNPTTKPHNSTSDYSQRHYSAGRKRKRELFALTISEEQPLKSLGPAATFWSEPTPARRRRVSGHGPGPNIGPHLGKQKPAFSSAAMGHGGLSSLSSSVSGANPAAAAGNMRMKIMLNPPGLGFVPDPKCNFEIYPSGCYDENGSICDTSGSGLCVCRPGYSIRTGSVYCLRPAAIGEACYTTEQCERKVAHSGCFNYREEYREDNPSAFFGPSQSSWPMGECRCRIGHRYDEDQKACVRSLIGSWCSNVWDCDMAQEDEKGAESGHEFTGHHRVHGVNHSRSIGHGVDGSGHAPHSGAVSSRAKMANIVCEHNICNCSQFFHFNASAEECQFAETFGQSCRPGVEVHTPKRSTRARVSPLPPRHRQSLSYQARQLRSLPDDDLILCNLPTICSANGTCVCAEGFEHQASHAPQCQPINKGVGVGSHFTHYFHSGSSGRAGMKDHGVTMYDRGSYEGQSNVANFVEYVLYVLVPALVVIFMFKPCFRRIGEWRNHIHQYNSDSDFYLSANGLPPVIAEVNVVAPGGGADKQVPGQFTSYLPHMACHNAYIFESADGCYAYGSTCLPQGPTTNDPSMALVREKLQTIEETQSEEGALECANCAPTDHRPPCCTGPLEAIPTLINSAPLDHSPSDDELDTKDDRRLLESKADGIELTQFNKSDTCPPITDEQVGPPENADTKDL